MDWLALRLTLILAIVTTVVLVLLCVPLASFLSYRRGWSRMLIEVFVTMPLILPPTVLGYYVLCAVAPTGLVGAWWQIVFNQRLAFTFPAILLASLLFNLPFMVGPLLNAFDSVDRVHREVAWCLGLSRWKTWTSVTLPLAKRGIVTGILLTFAHCIGEFGVVLMVGGNIPGVTRTVSLSLYEDVLLMNTVRANTTAAVLVVFSLVILSTVHWIGRKPESVVPK